MMENKTKIDLKNKSIFITGVAGFIGSNLAKRLLSTVEGVKVVGLDNMNHYYDVRLKEARLNESSADFLDEQSSVSEYCCGISDWRGNCDDCHQLYEGC